MNRQVFVFSGAYASGKSETSINKALQLKKQSDFVTLVDFDTVEPAYCLRPLVPKLTQLGLNVIAQTDYFGLGEAASYVTQQQINCLNSKGHIVIDVGYGASGLDILDIINGIEKEKNLNIFLVINTAKFETKDKDSILEYINFANGLNKKPWKKFSGLISNTHFGNETTKVDIINGYNILKTVSNYINIPIVAIGVDEKLEQYFHSCIYDDIPIWFYKRFMPDAIW